MHQSKRFHTDEEHAAALHKAYAARYAQHEEEASLPLDAQVRGLSNPYLGPYLIPI
jgi:hypothetical protein